MMYEFRVVVCWAKAALPFVKDLSSLIHTWLENRKLARDGKEQKIVPSTFAQVMQFDPKVRAIQRNSEDSPPRPPK